ncbi:MAG TPA: hypothetical protein VJH22_06600 [Candidatus Nanoarchaeia archaeon]|nr:hypothetical protein [Candidatus Nanoarchaeia archaeon]
MDKKAGFLQVFGDTPTLRVLDFLLVNDDFDYSMTDIADLSGRGYSTLKLFWHTMESEGIVTLTRTIGNAKMYQLNSASPVVKKLKDLYWTVTKKGVHEALHEEITVDN